MNQQEDIAAIDAQAHIHHAYLLGLQLMVSSRKGPDVMGDWMFRLFRRQHLAKFLSSFEKLGLTGLPDAVACARYHVLSNNMGGVGVEYMEESDRKAWVRFRYPRWMYHGPTLCGVPVEVSRGFLNGWYAHNGVSLGNPNLGYVCVSEDMTGEFGLCGYFKEFDHALAPAERLQFDKEALPPPFDENRQPQPPMDQWDSARLAKANRNYAMEYIRNGLCELSQVIGVEESRSLGQLAARLIGLQYYAETARMLEINGESLADAGRYLQRMFSGMGDTVVVSADEQQAQLEHSGLRVLRDLSVQEAGLVMDCWAQLWAGTMSAQRQLKALAWEFQGDKVSWQISQLNDRRKLAL